MVLTLIEDLKRLRKIVDYYRVAYHEVYVKACRYTAKNRVKIYGMEKENKTFFGVVGDEETHWVYFDGKKFLCSCLDFFYNITMKRQEREYCSHILAGIILLTKKFNHMERRDVSPRSVVNIAKINEKNVLSIILDDIGSTLHGLKYGEKSSRRRDI